MKNYPDVSLIEFLTEHAKSHSVSFHMPGHKGSRIFREFGFADTLQSLVDMDITEIPGADNLFQPETVIKNLMDRYSRFYGCHSFLSIGGSSAGLIAAILTAVEQTGKNKVIIARNSHKSIYNAIRLAGGSASYVYPKIIDDFGISGRIEAADVEAAILECEAEAAAVVLTSPNYYGIISDIESISRVCHEHGVILIVDQAHGAHLKLLHDHYPMEIPGPAEELGADIVVSSTHKTLASFTQTAIINVCGDLIDKGILKDKLQMIESSSPSYILMASLEMNIELLENHGEVLAERWVKNLKYFYEEASKIPGLRVLMPEAFPLDPTKLILDFRETGYSGEELEEALLERGIVLELSDANIAMAMTGIGNVRSDYEELIDALKVLPTKAPGTSESNEETISRYMEAMSCLIGTVAKQAIIPYPPGIPLIAAGEVITEEALMEAIELRARGQKVIGIDL